MARVLALLLVALLVLGTIASIVFTHAHGEEIVARDAITLDVEFLEEEQALRIRQRLLYINRTGGSLDRVEFSLYANMFRRQTALMYEGDVWQDVFPLGNAPGGVEFSRILVDGEAADWGMMGEEELFLRVACDLEAGQMCEFTFEYTLLLTQNAASLGVGEMGWRLRGFYLQPLKYEYGEFVAPEPLQHANYVYADRADYALTITLPERYLLAGPGAITSVDNGDGARVWTLEAENIRELCLSLGMRWREYSAETPSGTRLRLLAADRRGAQAALETALEALEAYENWFGPLAWDVTIAQSDYALGTLSLPGLIWAGRGRAPGRHGPAPRAGQAVLRLRRLSHAHGGRLASPIPSDAYAACLALKEAEGESAFLRISSTARSSPRHSTRCPAAWRSHPPPPSSPPENTKASSSAAARWSCTRCAPPWARKRSSPPCASSTSAGLEMDVVGEYDLVSALDDASGGDWEAFLTDWLFNVADYYVESYTLDSIQ